MPDKYLIRPGGEDGVQKKRAGPYGPALFLDTLRCVDYQLSLPWQPAVRQVPLE